jgi:membrane protein
MTFLDRLERWWDAHLASARARRPLVDHIWRAGARHSDVYGWRLAAAIAYYAFFAAFALAVLVFTALGLVLRGNQTVVHDIELYLQRNLPQVKITEVIATSQNLGWIALVGLALAGIGWVESLRSSQRAVWDLEQQPGPFVIRWLVDVAVLIGLGILMVLSVSISAGLQDFLFRLAGRSDQDAVAITLRQTAVVLAGLVDLVLAAALLAGVPRLRMPFRRLWPSALIVAVGLWLLKTGGRWYIARTQHNPAYSVVAGQVGLLVFMYLFHQLVLFAAAFAATSRHGTVVDLAAGPVPELVPDVAPEPMADATPDATPDNLLANTGKSGT